MKKIILTPLMLIFVASTLFSQEKWSLEKCINYAWENNLSIKQQELSVQRGENQLLQSKLDILPGLNGSVSHSMNWGKSVDLKDLKITYNNLSQSTSASLSTSVSLFSGLSKFYTVKDNETSLQISLQDVEKTKNDISISITKAFLQIMLSKEILVSREENFKSISEQCERTRKLVDAGSQAYSALLEIESQVASERVQLVSAKNQLANNYLSLVQLLDLPLTDQFDIDSPEISLSSNTFESQNTDSVYNASQALPQIKSAELSLLKSQYELSIAKGRLYPSISFNAGYGSYYSTTGTEKFMDQFTENRNPSMGISLSIPIFNQWQVKTSIKNAELSVKNSEIELRSKHQNLYKEIQQAISDADSYYQQYCASEINMKAMEESFRYVEQKFNIGVLNGTDYTVAKTNLSKAQSDFLQAKYQYVFQLKIIDFYKGIPISL